MKKHHLTNPKTSKFQLKKNYKLGQWKYMKLFSSLLNEWPIQIVPFSMSFGMENKKINKKESDIRLTCG